MKKYVFVVWIVTISMLLVQCKTRQEKRSAILQSKSIYIENFKVVYIKQYLLKSYSYSPEIQQILITDHSQYIEPILTKEDWKLIDSLTTIDNQNLARDSARNIGQVAEGAEGKHVFTLLLNKIDSQWLDSLANIRYKKAKLLVKGWLIPE